MKNFLLILSAVAVLYGCSSNKNIRTVTTDIIEVTVEQDGSPIDIVEDTAELRRSKFTLKFRLAGPESILVNASFADETYNNALEGLPLAELAGFRNSGIAEDLFNKDSVIYISHDTPNFWYYTDDTDHRFTSVTKSDNGYICSRDISGVIDLDSSGEKTDLGGIRKKELFLVMIKSEWNEDYTRLIEKSRKIIKLKFII